MKKEEKIKHKTREHFNKSAKNYDNSSDGKFVKCMYDEIVKRALSIQADAILDLGCGNGNVLERLMMKMNAALYGLDLSSNMIVAAQEKLGDGVDLRVGDAANLPYEDNTFNLIICNASFHHYPDPVQVLQEIHRVLRPGGTLILGDPTGPSEWILKIFNWMLLWSNSGDYKIYGKKEICTLLSNSGFKVFDWEKINYRTFIVNAVY